MVLVAAIFLVYQQAVAAKVAQTTTVRLIPPATARSGEAIEVLLVAEQARNLAGFQATVHFDASRLRLSGALLEKDLQRSGRDLLVLGPVMRDGSVALGAATCPVVACAQPPRPGVARIDHGVSGRVVLARLTFYTEAPGAYVVSLENVRLVDPQGRSLPLAVSGTVLNVRTR
ncbi:cohesin domain-containing protein [Kallotenue papyrolyticum]|uniref:cohesin domain-containing protein n=1 Tax=Kallotenue papyrolyticum TaxID=1325125 RepID=UPI000478577E|nr:cohesin domain-containing protein [Kallotenue papyrolyticum]